MTDLHYDLLTFIYSYYKNNSLDKLKEYCLNLYNKDNITKGILNLYYLKKEKMKSELNIDSKDLDIKKMLKKVLELNKSYNFYDEHDFVYGIEGCDYLRIKDLPLLKDLNVRSIIPVWNYENKYATGVKGRVNRGLTNLGKNLIKELIRLEFVIDISHCNEKTINDIFNIIDKSKIKPLVIASHCNVKSICNVKRNLTDKHLLKIKELNGLVGIVSYKQFVINVTDEDLMNKHIDYKSQFLDHILYLKELFGSVDNICIASDDMTLDYKDPDSEKYNVFKHFEYKKELIDILKTKLTLLEIDKILNINYLNRFRGLKNE